MRKVSRLLLIVSVLLLVSPLALRADQVTENFTITLNGTTNSDFTSTSTVKLFNTSLGTLTDVAISVTSGSSDLTLTTAANETSIDFYITDSSGSAHVVSLSGSSPYTFTFSGSDHGSPLSKWEGTGTRDVTLTASSDYPTIDTLSGTLTGTVTYYYTPSPVPEPSSVVLLGAGLLGLVVIGGFKKRAARPVRH